jgi:hypothetical protein
VEIGRKLEIEEMTTCFEAVSIKRERIGFGINPS